jgi:hypothetical protein
MDPLRTCLLDLLYELRDQNVPLTVGGGFGLFLKRVHLAATRARTLFTELPESRATNDIDVFLRADLLTDRSRTEALVAAIQRLGYVPVEEAKYFQWRRPIDVGGVVQEVKLDALVGPLGDRRPKLQVNSPRVEWHRDLEREPRLPVAERRYERSWHARWRQQFRERDQRHRPGDRPGQDRSGLSATFCK